MDRFDDADSVFAGYRREAEEFGASWALEFCQRCVAYVRMMAGRLSDAAMEAEAALALIDAFDMWQDSDVPFGVLALVSFHRNDLEAAHAFVSRSGQYTTVRAHSPPRYLDLAEALLHEAEGDSGERSRSSRTPSTSPRCSPRTCRSMRPLPPGWFGWPNEPATPPGPPPLSTVPTDWPGSIRQWRRQWALPPIARAFAP